MMKIIKFFMLYFIIILFKYFIIHFNSKIFLKNNKKKIMKKVILSKIFTNMNRKINNINNIKILYIKGKLRFGNFFISINNAIIYCEILQCKKIIKGH